MVNVIFSPTTNGTYQGDLVVASDGGTVAVRSSAAEGTTFEARLPRTPAPAPVSGGPAGPLGSQPA